jgi:signal transduction histidine kinase
MDRWSDRALRRLALGSFLVVVGLVVTVPPLTEGLAGRPGLSHDEPGINAASLLYALLLALSGVLLTFARPRNSVGWLLTLSGALDGVCEAGQVYGARALVVPDSDLPFGALVLSWSAPLWLPSLIIPATLLLARYPTGEIRGRWARRFDRGALVGMVCLWLGYAGSAASVTDEVKGATPPVLLPTWLGAALGISAAVLVVSALLFTIGNAVRRTLRASFPERQQLAWLLTVAPVGLLVTLFSPYEWMQKVLFGIPLAIVVGVLRYRLLGIQVVVRRTLLYGSLTGLTLLAFVAVTAALTSVLPHGPAPQVLAASVVAVGLVPARERLQTVVDRFVYGDSGDPVAALTRLASPVAEGEDLLGAVAQTVAQGLRAPGADVVAGLQTASWGDLGEQPVVQPLVIGGDRVGELRVAPRSGERRVRREDRELLSAVAPFVATVVRSVDLAQQVRVEQQRVVLATEAERSRLRHDLHDGLGPSLTGIGLGLEAAQSADPKRAGVILTRLRQEVAAALDEVRRIIDDLHPGALETADLLSLLRAKAAALTSGTPVRVTVEAPDELPRLPAEVEGAAWRVLEEALTNVVRHAGATSCTVTVTADEVLRLEVVDDGRGYDGPREGGVGVNSMEQRASRLGGRFSIATADQGGTRVAVELSLGVPA